jgi:alpha-beta hydrolase superfamily lysophospholipase
MPEHSQIRVDSYSGASQWDPTQPGKSFATVAVLPGRGETAGAYRRLGARLAYDSFATHVLDWDASADPRDLEAVGTQIKDLHRNGDARFLFLLGSDVGAVAALALAAGAHVSPDGLILGGLTHARLSAAVDWEGEIAVRSACGAYRRQLEAEPGIRRGALHDSAVPQALIDAAIPERVDVPVLLLRGENDPLTSAEEANVFAERLAVVRQVTLRGGRHDVFNEQNSRSVSARIVEFIEWVRGGDLDRPHIWESAPAVVRQLHPAA